MGRKGQCKCDKLNTIKIRSSDHSKALFKKGILKSQSCRQTILKHIFHKRGVAKYKMIDDNLIT